MPDPFISRDDLTDYLGRDVTNDNGALIAVDAACEVCRTVAEQDFNRATETITLNGTGTDALLLPQQPVNAAGTVTVDGGTITDYTLDTRLGILYRGTAGAWPRPAWPYGRQNVTVTYDHGYDVLEVPRDVRLVALSVASRLIVQGVAAEEQLGTQRIKYAANATDLTKGEQMILRKHRRSA